MFDNKNIQWITNEFIIKQAKKTKRTGIPTMHISKTNVVSFSKAITQAFNISADSPVKVKIGIVKENNLYKIILKQDDNGELLIKKNKHNSNSYVSKAKSVINFIRANGLNESKLLGQYIEKEKMFIFE